MHLAPHVARIDPRIAIAPASRRPSLPRRVGAAAFLVRGRIGRFANLARTSTEMPPLGSPDWALLEKHVTRQCLRAARDVPLVLIGVICAGWLVASLFLPKTPEEQAIFTRWRLTLIALFALMHLTFWRVEVAKRHPALTSTPFAAAAASVIAYFVARLGGLEQPYFFMLCTVLYIPAVIPIPLPGRIGFVLALASGLTLGFFGANPAYLDSPLLGEALLFLVVSFAGSVIAGHTLYLAVCQRFFDRLALSRAADELEALNGALDARVRQKTAELARLAEHLQIVQEEERGRIARELHDELGQRLSAMRFVLANTRQRFARAPAAIAPNLSELDAMLAGTLDCSRSIVSELRPPVLDQLGLAAAIEWLALRMGERAGIACELDLSGDDAVSPTVALAAYRVLQESLTNVIRHSGAQRMKVRLDVSAGALSLEVTDDGCGFPAGADRPLDRNGLVGMRERAFALGGQLETGDAPGGGARVCLSLPVVTAEVSS